jgi:soluble lytic murein transglycosylase-like protein
VPPWYFFSQLAQADCVDEAAKYHNINGALLRAVGWHESRLTPTSIGVNKEGSLDLGAWQINSQHLRKLARFGVDKRQLMNSCMSAYVGAWMLKECGAAQGNTWDAVGCYHSPKPARQAWYANQIAAVLRQWNASWAAPSST